MPGQPKRPSLREAARRGATSPPPAAKTPQPPQKPGAPPVVRHETVKALCGHEVLFGLFDDKKDKFRDARRKKVTDRPCPTCRAKANEERTAREKAAAAEKRKARQGEPGWKARYASQGRLPHGSRFVLDYDDTQKAWTGTLMVPGYLPFGGQHSGVMRLCQILDGFYRDAATPVEVSPGGGPEPVQEGNAQEPNP